MANPLKYPLDFRQPEKLEASLRDYFLESLREYLQVEQQGKDYNLYLQQLIHSGFSREFDLNLQQISGELVNWYAVEGEPEAEVLDRWIDTELNRLLDLFVVGQCDHLNIHPIPKSVLNYLDVRYSEEVNLEEMIYDYLDFPAESEAVYTNFLSMDQEKLKNAIRNFLVTEKGERIFFICNQSLLGSCKEGFAMTDRALYWRAHFQPARKVSYTKLDSVTRKRHWILINDHFFNVNPSFNIKLLKLMKKLKRLYASSFT
jgi:transcriptional antiterminator Rof (Rho-off)